jgi:competence protein ComFC
MGHMPANLAYRAYQLIWEALDWLYPPRCGGCGQPGSRWCGDCSTNIQEINPPICPMCGNPNINENLCSRCLAARPAYTALRSYTVFSGPIREAIHRLKYQRDIGLGEILARPMIKSLQKLNWSLDMMTSVPLGLVRFEERGYNQATLLARPIALSMRLPFSAHLLTRARETKTQVGLTVSERQENVAGAFRAMSKLVRGKNILVIDDVATSGATFNACAKALLDGGASNVYGFSLARAIYKPDNRIDLS